MQITQSGFPYLNGTITYTGLDSRPYLIQISISGDTATNITFVNLVINGIERSKITFSEADSASVNGSLSFIQTLNTNDTISGTVGPVIGFAPIFQYDVTIVPV